MRFLSSTLSLNSLRPINVSGHIFNITRTSIEGSLPLESTLSVANVTTDIEGTRIDCLNNGSNLSTIIHVIRVGEEGIAVHIVIITIINSIIAATVHHFSPKINKTEMFMEDGVVYS